MLRYNLIVVIIFACCHNILASFVAPPEIAVAATYSGAWPTTTLSYDECNIAAAPFQNYAAYAAYAAPVAATALTPFQFYSQQHSSHGGGGGYRIAGFGPATTRHSLSYVGYADAYATPPFNNAATYAAVAPPPPPPPSLPYSSTFAAKYYPSSGYTYSAPPPAITYAYAASPYLPAATTTYAGATPFAFKFNGKK